jgi:ankyrin repeat protein
MRRARFLATVGFLFVCGVCAAWAGTTEDFFIAVRNDNDSALREFLAHGVDPNVRDAKGQSGLMVAMQENASKVARILIAWPTTDLDALNNAGESALMLAALKGDLPDAQLLLDRGVRVNQAGWSALHYAASGPEAQLVALLLARGAAIDAASPNGSTPLMMAAQYGSEDSVRLLVARGADPRLRNQLGLGAADFARRAGRESLARQLDQVSAPR